VLFRPKDQSQIFSWLEITITICTPSLHGLPTTYSHTDRHLNAAMDECFTEAWRLHCNQFSEAITTWHGKSIYANNPLPNHL